jgi:hypothetical protein
VSKKLPGIGVFAVEREVVGQTSAERPQSLQQLISPWLSRHGKFARVGNANLDFIARLQLQQFDDGGGETNGEAIAPFRNLHGTLRGYT